MGLFRVTSATLWVHMLMAFEVFPYYLGLARSNRKLTRGVGRSALNARLPGTDRVYGRPAHGEDGADRIVRVGGEAGLHGAREPTPLHHRRQVRARAASCEMLL
jgi:hypothetical protein